MATRQGALLLAAGAAALLFMSRKKKTRGKAKAEPGPAADEVDDEDLDEDEDDDVLEDDEELFEEPEEESAGDALERLMNPEGRAQLGMLYQIRLGDTPLEVCREALFGSRDPVADPAMIQAARDLLIRIDCGPWNQACYAVPLSEMMPGHAEIDSYFTQRGVSFNPIYQNNQKRIREGLAPTSKPGHSFALIWIPMINLERFDMDGTITTEGMYHPDTPLAMGGSMIDPPDEILNLEFDEVSGDEVGCDLPEGDYRKTIIANA